MHQIGDMNLYTLDEVTDNIIGKKGTPERDEFDRKVEASVHAYPIGETIKLHPHTKTIIPRCSTC